MCCGIDVARILGAPNASASNVKNVLGGGSNLFRQCRSQGSPGPSPCPQSFIQDVSTRFNFFFSSNVHILLRVMLYAKCIVLRLQNPAAHAIDCFVVNAWPCRISLIMLRCFLELNCILCVFCFFL